MKRLGLLAVAGLLLAGCASPATTSVTDEQSFEEMALEVLREQEPSFRTVPDDVIWDVTESTCALLDAGGTFEDYVLVSFGTVTPEQAGALFAMSVLVVCPEHEGHMP